MERGSILIMDEQPLKDQGNQRAGVFIDEMLATIKLALPVVIGEIGWMAMGVADTVLVSHLGPQAIGAAGIGSSVYFTFAVFGMGLFLGLDTLVSQSHGAGKHDESRQWLRTGLLLAIALTPGLPALFALILQPTGRWGFPARFCPWPGPTWR